MSNGIAVMAGILTDASAVFAGTIRRRMGKRSSIFVAVACLFLTTSGCRTAPKAPVDLKVSADGHSLVEKNGKPFVYLADTAWELFHRLDREEADLYLTNRAAKRFTVIQAVVLAELDGLTVPNRYGDLPLVDNDPTKPNDAYFRHVDWVVNRADSLGLVVAMLPTWGDKVNKKWGVGPVIFTPENAETYGRFIGTRYKDRPIIWMLGGDRPVESDQQLAVWRAMAKGLREGDNGRHLITYHTMGGHSSSESLHDEPWLDFNTLQSGHSERDAHAEAMIAKDYAMVPPKPTLNSEPCYEDHPVNWKPANGWFDEYDVRKAIYSSLFAGGCGVTYGCHDVWQFWTPDRTPISFARTPWQEALDLPGAGQMQFARKLLESRPYLTRGPDRSLLVPVDGQFNARAVATRDANGSFAMVYFPSREGATVDLTKLSGPVRASWFDPRTGRSRPAGVFDNGERREFIPPSSNRSPDWVLLLDVVKN
jgi:hypothetical protein